MFGVTSETAVPAFPPRSSSLRATSSGVSVGPRIPCPRGEGTSGTSRDSWATYSDWPTTRRGAGLARASCSLELRGTSGPRVSSSARAREARLGDAATSLDPAFACLAARLPSLPRAVSSRTSPRTRARDATCSLVTPACSFDSRGTKRTDVEASSTGAGSSDVHGGSSSTSPDPSVTEAHLVGRSFQFERHMRRFFPRFSAIERRPCACLVRTRRCRCRSRVSRDRFRRYEARARGFVARSSGYEPRFFVSREPSADVRIAFAQVRAS